MALGGGFFSPGGGSGVCGVVGFAWEGVGVVDGVVGMWMLVGWLVGCGGMGWEDLFTGKFGREATFMKSLYAVYKVFSDRD